MNDKEFLKEMINRGSIADDGYFQYAHLVACLLDKRLHEQLIQLHDGPIWDGDVICKTYRDELIQIGLATRICCKGEQGYTDAVYFAHTVIRAIKDIKSGKIGA